MDAVYPGAQPCRGRRKSSISASTAGRCRAIRGAGSRSRRSPRRWTARLRSSSIPNGSASSCPTDFEMPPGGFNIRWPDQPLEQEPAAQIEALRGTRLRRRQPARPHRHRQPAAALWHRHDRQILSRRAPGAGRSRHRRRGCRRDRLSPLQGRDVVAARTRGRPPFRRGLDEILVVEEKRARHRKPIQGTALQLAGGRPAARHRQVRRGRQLDLAVDRRIDPGEIARVIADRIAALRTPRRAPGTAGLLEAKERQIGGNVVPFARTPVFLLRVPAQHLDPGARRQPRARRHRLPLPVAVHGPLDRNLHPDGRRGRAVDRPGAVHRRRRTSSPISATAPTPIRASWRSAPRSPPSVNMTYKVLFNDAVAMTGGQPLDGGLTVPVMPQLAAEGVARIVVVTDEPDKYPANVDFPPGTTVHHRDDLDAVQRELREIPGVTAMVYDQTCAAEKRRRRKRGRFPDPPKRVFINDLVCEGCGDCSKTSNCVSVMPVETEFGRKRAIDQSSCNKDYSCVKGFCPSFVTVHGGGLKKRSAGDLGEDGLPPLPEPAHRRTRRALWHSRHRRRRHRRRDDRRAARHGGASRRQGRHRPRHDRHRPEGRRRLTATCASPSAPTQIHAVRIAAGSARLLLGCDLVVSASADALSQLEPASQPRDRQQPRDDHRRLHPQPRSGVPTARAWSAASPRRPAATAPNSSTRPASRPALLGDSIASNLFMLGYAYQRGLVPLSAEAIERAIELNARRRRLQPRRLPLGPARRRRSGARRSAARHRPAAVPASHRSVGNPRPDHRPPHRVPDRLPGPRLCRPLCARGAGACATPRRRLPRRHRADRGGGPQRCSS